MIRIGVIGNGVRISNVINLCLRKIDPELKVVAIVDPDEAGARKNLDESDRQEVVFYDDVASMMSKAKLDAVAVGTRCNLHTPYSIELAKYDVPVYMEKPVAVTMEQALALETAYENAKCPVVVSFPLRVSPLSLLTREYVKNGAVGRPDHVLATNYVPYGTVYWDKLYRNFKITQGLFLQKATHDFDYMMYLMGSSITRVSAMANYGRIFGGDKPAGLRCKDCDETYTCLESPRNRSRHMLELAEDHFCNFAVDCGNPQEGMNEDCSSALVEFASGAHGVYTQVFFARRDAAQRGATISGYEGTLSFDWYKNELRRIRHHQPFSETIKAADGMSHFGGDDELAYDFIDIIRGKGTSRTPMRMGIQSVYACLAAKESAETGKFVNVRQCGSPLPTIA